MTIEPNQMNPVLRIFFLGMACLNISDSLLWAQDSSVLVGKSKWTWNIQLAAIKQDNILNFDEFNLDPPLHLPKDELLRRRRDEPTLAQLWGLQDNRATDNPLFHLPVWVDAYVKQEFGRSFTAEFRAILEQRGASYGYFNQKNLAIIPQFKLNYFKDFNIESDTLQLNVFVGNENQFSWDERLVLYNLSIFSDQLRLKYRKWDLAAIHIGDLAQGIGLGIDDAWKTSLYRSFYHKENKFRVGVGYGIDAISSELLYHNFDLMFSWKRRGFKFYTQVSNRYSRLSFHRNAPFRKNFAGIIGTSLEGRSGRFSYKGRLESRYFGAFYNTFLRSTNVYYREKREVYANTVGNQLYPLYQTLNPFMQWAEINQYNANSSTWVVATSYQNRLNYKLNKYFGLDVNLDLNLFVPEKLNVMFYGFYSAGVNINLPAEYQLFVGCTNKGMNLDLHFPSFYQYKYPLLEVRFMRILNPFDKM